MALQIPFGDIERLGGTASVWLILKKTGPPAHFGNVKVLPKFHNDAAFYDLVEAMRKKDLQRNDGKGGVELVATVRAVPLTEGGEADGKQ